MDRSPFRVHALGLIGMGAMMSIMMTTPVIALYLNARGLAAFHIGAVIGIMSLALVLAEIVLAVLVSHRIGRRATVAVALTGSAVMLGGFPLMGSLVALYANRIAFGGIRGLLWPVTFAEVADAAPPERRGSSFAIFWLYFGAGTLIGPAVGGLLGDRLTLVAPFYAAAVISMLTLPLVNAVRGDRDAVAGNPLAGYPALLRNPWVSRTWGLTVCNVIAFSIYAAFLPLHAAAHGLSAAHIGIIFTGGAVAFIIGQDALRRLSHRVPAERMLVPAFIARGLGVAVVPLLASFSGLLLANFLTGIVVAAIPLALSMRIAGQAPRGHLIAAMGGFNASADFGFFVGPVIGGLLAGFGLRWAFLVAIPVTGVALLLLRGRRSDEPVEHHRSEENA